jgi:inhibitor of KinA
MFDIKLAGENAIIIYFGDEVAPELVEKIAFYTEFLHEILGDLIIDIVPSYTTALITYDLNVVSHQAFCNQVSEALAKAIYVKQQHQSDMVEIPVYYDREVGLDLDRLLSEKQLSLDEFIHIHSNQTYLVYAIGFSPAFAFLAEVDERIQAPRLLTPRIQIPAGSVGIADNQTAVYPIESSGGWNIVGRTPIDLSLTNNKNLNLNRFKVGHQVKFKAISRQKFLALGGRF